MGASGKFNRIFGAHWESVVANLVVNQVFQIRSSFSTIETGSSVYVNRSFWRVTATSQGGTPTEANVAEAYGQVMSAAWKQVSSLEFQYLFTEVQTWENGIRTVGAKSDFNAGPGEMSGSGTPPTVAWVVRKKTAFAGRAYRGRAFVVGLANGMHTGGAINNGGTILINASQLPAILASTRVLSLGASGTATIEPLICQQNGAGVPIVRAPVISFEWDPILRSQRRRENGVGT